MHWGPRARAASRPAQQTWASFSSRRLCVQMPPAQTGGAGRHSAGAAAGRPHAAADAVQRGGNPQGELLPAQTVRTGCVVLVVAVVIGAGCCVCGLGWGRRPAGLGSSAGEVAPRQVRPLPRVLLTPRDLTPPKQVLFGLACKRAPAARAVPARRHHLPAASVGSGNWLGRGARQRRRHARSSGLRCIV